MRERITSRANPLMTHIRKLASSRAYRQSSGAYMGDGAKLLEEAVRWRAALQCVVCTADAELPELPAGVRLAEVPRDVMRSISPMEAPQGALFTAALPDQTLPERLTGSRYLALEGVQDPGNVGTILRTADALGADGLLLLPGCADLFNPKTVRASMGALFRLPVWRCTLAELRTLGERSSLPLLGSALGADAADVRRAGLERAVTLIGSEGRGLSGGALAICGGTVRIPMRERCESLNAAAAAAILLWEGFR